MNPLLLTDSYKLTHWKQYPSDTTGVYSYFESRGGAFPDTVFFGLHYVLRRHFETPITLEMVDGVSQLSRQHFGADYFNDAGWRHVVRDHGGLLPLRIKAVAEGTVVAVFRKGYALKDRLLRPALVKVAKAAEDGSGASSDEKVH